MTETHGPGHATVMFAVLTMYPAGASPGSAGEGRVPARSRAEAVGVDFDAVYEQTFEFVWRSLRRLGVPDANLDDAAQDVFVVVHRRLREFEGRSSVKTWVFGIALRVASDHRRSIRRRGPVAALDENLVASGNDTQRSAERLEGLRLLDAVLDRLEDDRRAVFVLAELEEMTAPEIAEAIGIPLNTVYSRLRLAREDFERAASRVRSRTS